MYSDASSEPGERRAHDRADFSSGAMIDLPQGNAIPCKVQNLSEGGGVLVLTDEKVIPVRFWLSIPEQQFKRECMVCRFSGSRIAVKFLP